MAPVTGSATMVLDKQNYIVRLVAIQYSEDNAYHFLMLMPQSKYQALSQDLQRMSYSFSKISQAQADQIKGRKIRIVTAQRGDTVESIARYMAFDDYKVERFTALNGLTAGQQLRTGQRL